MNTCPLLRRLFALSFLLFSMVAALQGQPTGASLMGRIDDPAGAIIVGARVSALNEDTGIHYESTSNGSGIYHLVSIPPGVYLLEVEKVGFKKLVKPMVLIHAEDSIQIDCTMTIGNASEEVTVTANEALAGTGPGALSTVVEREFVDSLPLNGRSFQELFLVAPGVSIAGATFSDQGQIVANGQRADANYFSVDGVSANFGVNTGPLGQSAGGALPALTATGGFNGLVSLDAIRELRIQTSTFAPQYGRMPGAQIEIATRSGTNRYHGSMFEYFRNDKLDANDWFANQLRQARAKERQSDFGGVFGGPIVPNRAFFFVSYEGLRLRQPHTDVAIVPDLTVRNNAPQALQPILAAYPIPNGPDLPGGLAQYSASLSSPIRSDAGSVRVDDTFGKLALFGRFSDSPSSGLMDPGVPYSPNVVESVKFDSLTSTVGVGWTISSASHNDLRFSFSRSRGASSFQLTNIGGAVPFDAGAVFPSFSDFATDSFVFTCCNSTARLDLGANADNTQRQFNIVENFSYLRGAHLFMFGMDFRRSSPVFGRKNYENQFLYPNVDAILANVPSQVLVDTAPGASGLRVVANNLSGFAQDDWRIARTLTLTYGIRWEYNPAPFVANRTAPWVVDQIENLATTQLVSANAPLWHSQWNNFAPRVGIAYKLLDSGDRATMVRGGAGIFYDLGFGQLGDVFAANAQYYGQKTYFTSVSFPLSPAQQLPPPLFDAGLPVFEAAVFDPRLKLPYSMEWNITFEQRMKGQAFTVSYVGAAGRRLLLETFHSMPNPSFSNLLVTNNGATSDYEALQMQYRRQVIGPVQAVGSYTWSHSIDTSSSDSYVLSESPGRASSNFDVRHSVSGALNYKMRTAAPSGFLGRVLSDWSIAGIVVGRSALPITVVSTKAIVNGVLTANPPSTNAGVPFWVADPNVAGGRRINVSAFAAPPTGQVGSAPRNFLRGFDAWQSDVALRREFMLSERLKVQFRGELFNVLNHPNFANPTATLSSPFFGISSSMLNRSLGSGGALGGFAPLYQLGGPRSGQLVLKLEF